MKTPVENKHKIYVTHFRKFPSLPGLWTRTDAENELGHYAPLSKEGATEARIVDQDGNLISEGWAVCGKRDNFSKRIGRTIAVGRALKNLKAAASI